MQQKQYNILAGNEKSVINQRAQHQHLKKCLPSNDKETKDGKTKLMQMCLRGKYRWEALTKFTNRLRKKDKTQLGNKRNNS